MADKNRILLVGVLVSVIHAVDIAFTRFADPHLISEVNIFHTIGKVGWPGLIVIKAVSTCLTILGYTYYLQNREKCYPTGGPSVSLSQFANHILFRSRNREHRLILIGYLWTGMQSQSGIATLNGTVFYGMGNTIVLIPELVMTTAYCLGLLIVLTASLLAYLRESYQHYSTLPART